MRGRIWPVLVVVLGAGCSHARGPHAVPIVAPDGAPALHVSCGDDEAECYELAGQSCPFGYGIAKSAGEPGNFLVRCRRVSGAGTSWPPSSDVIASPYGPPSNVSWPPPSELLPSPYATGRPLTEPLPSPYPSSRPTGTAGFPPTTAPAPAPKDDLGY